jgi:hypothetical protein
MDCSPTIQGEALAWSVIVAAVVAPDEPIAATGRNIFLVETIASSAKPCLPIAAQMFKMQLNQVRTVEIGREVMTGMGIAAHVDDGISHFRRQALDMFRIQGSSCPTWLPRANAGRSAKLKSTIVAAIAESRARTAHTPVSLHGGRRCIRKTHTIRNPNGRQ